MNLKKNKEEILSDYPQPCQLISKSIFTEDNRSQTRSTAHLLILHPFLSLFNYEKADIQKILNRLPDVASKHLRVDGGFKKSLLRTIESFFPGLQFLNYTPDIGGPTNFLLLHSVEFLG